MGLRGLVEARIGFAMVWRRFRLNAPVRCLFGEFEEVLAGEGGACSAPHSLIEWDARIEAGRGVGVGDGEGGGLIRGANGSFSRSYRFRSLRRWGRSRRYGAYAWLVRS